MTTTTAATTTFCKFFQFTLCYDQRIWRYKPSLPVYYSVRLVLRPHSIDSRLSQLRQCQCFDLYSASSADPLMRWSEPKVLHIAIMSTVQLFFWCDPMSVISLPDHCSTHSHATATSVCVKILMRLEWPSESFPVVEVPSNYWQGKASKKKFLVFTCHRSWVCFWQQRHEGVDVT